MTALTAARGEQSGKVGRQELARRNNKKSEFVTAFARGLDVIQSFDKNDASMTLSEIANKARLSRATTRRMLFTLEDLGYVRSDGRNFSLRPRVLSLGYSYLASQPVVELALPTMKEVVDQLGESCSLSVLDGQDVVYIARVPPKHLMTIPVNVGTRLPAYVTSTGRVLLAALPTEDLERYLATVKIERFTKFTTTKERLPSLIDEARDKGYSLADQEMEEGLRALAVPIRSQRGEVIAGINVSAHAMRANKAKMLKSYLPVLRKAAEEIGGK